MTKDNPFGTPYFDKPVRGVAEDWPRRLLLGLRDFSAAPRVYHFLFGLERKMEREVTCQWMRAV
jgi:hypothetical protein